MGRDPDRGAAALETARESMALLKRLGGLLQGEALPPLALCEALRAAGRRAAARDAAKDAYRRLTRRARAIGRDDWRARFLALDDHVATAVLHSRLAGKRR